MDDLSSQQGQRKADGQEDRFKAGEEISSILKATERLKLSALDPKHKPRMYFTIIERDCLE